MSDNFIQHQFIRTDVVTTKRSTDGNQEDGNAIRAKKLESKCNEKNLSPIKPSELWLSGLRCGLGTQKSEQRFYLLAAGKQKFKTCFLVDRGKFKLSTLERIDQATRVENMPGTTEALANKPA